MNQLVRHADEINQLLARYGVRFGIYKNNEFHEELFPFDVLPRIIRADEFELLQRGLIQRVRALNLFLADIYGGKMILRDGVVPEEFVYASPGYLPCCEGVLPPGGIYAHISGIDLVQGKDGIWYVLEDNLRIPSGASYPLIARELCRKACPEAFQDVNVTENRCYGEMLREVMEAVNTGGINCILTPGRYNAAFFEHLYLAEQAGAVLVLPEDLIVEDCRLYYKKYDGSKEQVGALYRRISDEFLDPMAFYPESLIGVPHILDAYRAGNVALINTPGNGVADDKGIYYFVPKMISYYLNETPILCNAPTYLAFYEEDRAYILEHLEQLVIKDVAESGGYGVVFGSKLTEEQRAELRGKISDHPRAFIAQEVIDFVELPVMEGGQEVWRKADLRAFVLTGADCKVWPGGLTRFSRKADSYVVNSSQGGGFKDTWVLCQ